MAISRDSSIAISVLHIWAYFRAAECLWKLNTKCTIRAYSRMNCFHSLTKSFKRSTFYNLFYFQIQFQSKLEYILFYENNHLPIVVPFWLFSNRVGSESWEHTCQSMTSCYLLWKGPVSGCLSLEMYMGNLALHLPVHAFLRTSAQLSFPYSATNEVLNEGLDFIPEYLFTCELISLPLQIFECKSNKTVLKFRFACWIIWLNHFQMNISFERLQTVWYCF